MPPAPPVVAAWIKSEAEAGINTRQIELCLQAIQKVCDSYLLPSPIASAVVRLETGRALKVEPPRTWKKEEQSLFFSLPPEIRGVVARRSKHDSDLIRRLQNDNAELRRQLGTNSNQTKDIDSDVTPDQKTA
jgi:hypothetical protein